LAAICELPERQRLALHLFYLQENPAEDARQILKLSRSGFYRLLDRASANLKSRIENDRKGNP
jgi:RNA polymerase sigma-70 factor (ECF subfamily)